MSKNIQKLFTGRDNSMNLLLLTVKAEIMRETDGNRTFVKRSEMVSFKFAAGIIKDKTNEVQTVYIPSILHL